MPALPAPESARALRLPTQCEVCRGWADAALCPDCLARFAAPRLRCPRCAWPLPAPAPACGECLRDTPPFTAAASAVDYAFPWDALIAAFKFRERVDLARPLAALLARALRPMGGAPVEWLLPVPLSASRLRQRGYDQAWLLAQALARELGVPARPDLLQRVLDTPQQATLDRASRQRNLAGAFWVPPQAAAAVRGRHLALIDDVMTTGATLRAAAAALTQAGAATVQAWTVARTP